MTKQSLRDWQLTPARSRSLQPLDLESFTSQINSLRLSPPVPAKNSTFPRPSTEASNKQFTYDDSISEILKWHQKVSESQISPRSSLTTKEIRGLIEVRATDAPPGLELPQNEVRPH